MLLELPFVVDRGSTVMVATKPEAGKPAICKNYSSE